MARPIWKGAINFGLVNIPIEMVMAVHEKGVHFHMVSKDGSCRLRRKLYCPETDQEYDFSETAKGLEVAPNEYVIVDQKEIDRLKPESGKAMEIEQFVPVSAIDPVFYNRVYYLRPSQDSYKSYKLLLEAMQKTNKCAVARFIMRERQYLCVIRPIDEGLVLHTLHYADEVESLEDELPAAMHKSKVTAGELKIAEELIKAMTRPLEIDQFKDEYRERLEQLIEAKVKGKEMVEIDDEIDETPHRTINLMEALKKSLAANKGSNGHGNGRARPRRRKTSRT